MKSSAKAAGYITLTVSDSRINPIALPAFICVHLLNLWQHFLCISLRPPRLCGESSKGRKIIGSDHENKPAAAWVRRRGGTLARCDGSAPGPIGPSQFHLPSIH